MMDKIMNDLNLWQKTFSKIPPLGHVLREKFGNRWIRFHSLPESKRYADNDAEMAIILDRADILAKEILGENQCHIYASYDGHEISTEENSPVKKYYNLDQSFNWQQIDEDEAVSWTTYWKATYWNIDTYSPLIKK
jgi:hypothetical protein